MDSYCAFAGKYPIYAVYLYDSYSQDPLHRSDQRKVYSSSKRKKPIQELTKRKRYCSDDNILNAYSQVTQCCTQFKKVPLLKLEDERKMFWELKQSKKTEWIINYLRIRGSSEKEYNVLGVPLCEGINLLLEIRILINYYVGCFLLVYNFSRAHLYMCKRWAKTGVQTVVHAKAGVKRPTVRTENARCYLNDYIEGLGESLPNSNVIHLPYMERKDIYKDYKHSCKLIASMHLIYIYICIYAVID